MRFLRALLVSGPVWMVGAMNAPPADAELTTPQPWRSLTHEAVRAEVSMGGLFIDMGTADQHKFTRGGWETGWGDLKRRDEITFCGSKAEVARLRLAPWQTSASGLVARLRSPLKGQRVKVKVDGRSVGTVKIGRKWSTERLRFPTLDAAEGHVVTFEPSRRWSGDALEVDWVWLPTDASQPQPRPAPRLGPLDLGDGARQVLLAPQARQYAYHLIPDRLTSLSFEYGALGEGRFTVEVHDARGKTHALFSEAASDRWQRGSVDLAPFAGQVIRLVLSVEGEAPNGGWSTPTLRRALGGGSGKAAPASRPARNVVMIVIDTARADAFAPHFPDNEVKTPHFDALAAEGTAFIHTYNNENWTKPSVATILSGLYPETHGTRYVKHRLPEAVQILPEYLREKGFRTGAISANKVMGEQYGFVQGWDSFARGDEASDLYRDALQWVRAQKEQPFFLYLQPIDPHTPYDVPSKYHGQYYSGRYHGQLGSSVDVFEQDDVQRGEKTLSKDDQAWTRALYNGEITYHDEHFGKFIEALRADGLLDDTLLIVTNDHGEEFLEHGGMGHGWTLYEEMIRAPLLIRFPPAFPEGAHIDAVVEHVDLARTVTDTLGLPPMADVEGQSLLAYGSAAPAGLHPPYALSYARGSIEKRMVRVGPWKLIENDLGHQSLYNVTEDLTERRDLDDDRPLARRLCEILMGEALAVPDKKARLQGEALVRRFTSEDAVVDEETRRHLEALGYIGGAGEAQEGDAKPANTKPKRKRAPKGQPE